MASILPSVQTERKPQNARNLGFEKGQGGIIDREIPISAPRGGMVCAGGLKSPGLGHAGSEACRAHQQPKLACVPPPAVTPMLNQGADDMARIVRADRLRRPVLVQGDELDDGLAIYVGTTRTVFLERGFIIPFKLGNNEITRLGRNFRIDDDLIPSPELRQHAVARDGAPSKKKTPAGSGSNRVYGIRIFSVYPLRP